MCVLSPRSLWTPGQMVVDTVPSPSRSVKGKQTAASCLPYLHDWGPETLCPQQKEEVPSIQVFVSSFQQDFRRASYVPSTVVEAGNIERKEKDDVPPLTSVHPL